MDYIFIDKDTTRNININKCLHLQSRYAPNNPLIFSFHPLKGVNYQKVKRWAYRRLKTNREEHLKKHVVSTSALVNKEKLGKIMRKVATCRKKQDS